MAPQKVVIVDDPSNLQYGRYYHDVALYKLLSRRPGATACASCYRETWSARSS